MIENKYFPTGLSFLWERISISHTALVGFLLQIINNRLFGVFWNSASSPYPSFLEGSRTS